MRGRQTDLCGALNRRAGAIDLLIFGSLTLRVDMTSTLPIACPDQPARQRTMASPSEPHAADKQLVQRVLAKERVAFEQFFETYFSRLYRFCALRTDDDAAAEDIVQITLQKALRGLAGYRGEASLFTWLCQICRNEVANWRTANHRHSAMEVPLDDWPDVRAALESQPGSEHVDDTLALQRAVQLTLDHLPDHYGKALEWKYVEGLSVSEIGDRLQMNLVSVQSLLARARTAFRRSFTDLQQSIRTAQS